MVDFTFDVAGALVQFALSFYAFWLVWRILLPHLPGPERRDERVAPFVWYFTDPFIVPISSALRLPERLIALISLAAIAVLSVSLTRLLGTFS